ncbi:hypothetical protein D5R81_19745 [Parashewanella spongiae]|uniref:PepSY domain-containing protein n=1 Tax=Parashewanella spongiae TaxID=342950 RepID=A0A3A6T0F2_9GAMM|nr:PepSY domain-containing protein [Parashewanella spongiae]MCL1077019.1 PepSY domain-containing protein [Parashewanella spongiae]RJY01839.1 hypothetical protein D5R81_19745 [Parashewanella spongiae]
MWKNTRRWHWWLSILIGAQVLIWSLSGAYMVLTDIHFIRGQHLTKPLSPIELTPKHIGYGFQQVFTDYPEATDVQLNLTTQPPQIQFNTGQQIINVSIIDGKVLPRLTAEDISALAHAHYAEKASIKNIQLLEQAPSEISARHAPIWQVTFNDTANTTFYFNEETHQLVIKRHDFWRVFDFLWRLHIMDYWQGENIHTPWLTATSIFTLFMSLLGLLLIYPWLRHSFFSLKTIKRK